MGALQYLKRCACLLSVLFASIHSRNWNYEEHPLESDRVCSLGYSITPTFIDVGKDEHSGLIIFETEEKGYFDTLSGKYPFNCQFKIRATEDEMGLFAVIQKMRLRRNATTGACIDYVQFRRTHTYQVGPLNLELEKDADSPWGKEYCGNIVAKEVNFTVYYPTDRTRVLPHAHVEHKGKMDVRIYVANGSLGMRPKDLELRIAFTAFSKCKQAPSKTYKTCGEDSCIFHKYFNDGILNCPFMTCLDEGGCKMFHESGAELRPGNTGLATKVMVGAVAGVFTMFVVFVVFLWLFRHCSLCWSDTGPNLQNTTQMRPVPTVEDVQPSAPSRTPSIDKDLPPSYESLFPNS